MRSGAILLLLLLLVGCRHCLKCDGVGPSRSLTRYAGAEAPPVAIGRYPGSLRMLPADHPLSSRATSLRADVEAHETVLRRIVRGRISVKSPLEFQFMYVGHDSTDSRLVLRYFARAAVPDEVAGWQVQLVYSLPALQPLHAYVKALPLE